MTSIREAVAAAGNPPARCPECPNQHAWHKQLVARRIVAWVCSRCGWQNR